MKKKSMLVAMALLLGWMGCRADEGMWIPMLLKKYNIEDMQKQGFKLTAEDVYSINQASLKDAVVGLGREGYPFSHFCTAEIISDEGLMVTNHHCAFDMIQSHSSLEHNYLRDGFWAKDKQDELANPGITASILVRMEDVTDRINAQLTPEMSAEERNAKISISCLYLRFTRTCVLSVLPLQQSANLAEIRIIGYGLAIPVIFPYCAFMPGKIMNLQTILLIISLTSLPRSLKFPRKV